MGLGIVWMFMKVYGGDFVFVVSEIGVCFELLFLFDLVQQVILILLCCVLYKVCINFFEYFLMCFLKSVCVVVKMGV